MNQLPSEPHFPTENRGIPRNDSGMRVLFALWPSASLRSRLVQHSLLWHFGSRAKLTMPEKLHITVLFMDHVPEGRVNDLFSVGAEIAHASTPFILTLDHTEIWLRGGIAHLGPTAVPRQLTDLRDGLLQRVQRQGIPCDKRSFKPHVTIARHAEGSEPPSAFAPVQWRIQELSLIQSLLHSGRYAVLHRWRFSPRAQMPTRTEARCRVSGQRACD